MCCETLQAPAPSGRQPSEAVHSVQAAVTAVQKGISLFDGSLVQFRCDEKGFLSICAFGLPGKSHEDSPSRAVQAALMISAAMKKIDQVNCPCHTVHCLCRGRDMRACGCSAKQNFTIEDLQLR